MLVKKIKSKRISLNKAHLSKFNIFLLVILFHIQEIISKYKNLL